MDSVYALLQVAIPAVPFLFAILLAIFLAYGAVSFYYRPVTAMNWMIWIFVIETVLIVQPVLPLGVQLYLPDVFFLLIGIAGLFRTFNIKLEPIHRLWLLFGIVLMISFGIGVIKFGTKAGVEFRSFYYFWVGIWYLLTFSLSPEEVDKMVKSWMLAAAVMVAEACFRWTAQSTGMEIANYWNEGQGSLRVFDAMQTYFLVQALLVGFYAYLNKSGRPWWNVLLPILLICIVVLQHRTLWVVTIISVLVLILSAGKVRSRALSFFLIATLVGSAATVPLFASGKLDVIGSSLNHSVTEVGQKNSTLAWRVESWQALLSKWSHAGPMVNLIGYPFGSGYTRNMEASHNTVSVSPHSQYVSILLRTGVVGALAMLLAYYLCVKSMFKTPALEFSQFIDSKLLLAMLIGQLAFFITYSIHYSQLLPLGLALSMLIRNSRVTNRSATKELKSLARRVA